MNEINLKLIKPTSRRRVSQPPKPTSPVLTPAEMTEAARFRALTAARAARRAMIHRIMAEFEELDKSLPAA